jgi:hypothetical protein
VANFAIVTGKVMKQYEDREAVMLIVQTQSGTSKAGKDYTLVTACRFYGNARSALDTAGGELEGNLVEVTGEVQSRQTEKGAFTDFNARSVKIIDTSSDV